MDDAPKKTTRKKRVSVSLTPLHGVPERKRIDLAFRQIRACGGITMSHACCTDCAWKALKAKGAEESCTVAITTQEVENVAFQEGSDWMTGPLAIYHSGNSKMICDALEAHHLWVIWEGNDRESIVVLPSRVH